MQRVCTCMYVYICGAKSTAAWSYRYGQKFVQKHGDSRLFQMRTSRSRINHSSGNTSTYAQQNSSHKLTSPATSGRCPNAWKSKTHAIAVAKAFWYLFTKSWSAQRFSGHAETGRHICHPTKRRHTTNPIWISIAVYMARYAAYSRGGFLPTEKEVTSLRGFRPRTATGATRQRQVVQVEKQNCFEVSSWWSCAGCNSCS